MALAAVQIVVHMIYFLHMNTKSEGGWTFLALAFTLTLVVITLVWVDMGDVPHGPEHDADVAARGAAKALTRQAACGAGRFRPRRTPHRGRSRVACHLATPSPRLEARTDRARGSAGSRSPDACAGARKLADALGRF
jgi:hypothetical protein